MMALNRGRGEPRSGAAIQVPYGLLGTMAARDVDADADALDAGRFSAPSAELQRYAQWLSGYSFERFKQAGWSALTGLLQADSPASVRELFEAHPVLLDQRFDRLLAVRISKQDITRHCRYAAGGRACAVILVVPEKPDPMPSCPAQPGIAAHPFAW